MDVFADPPPKTKAENSTPPASEYFAKNKQEFEPFLAAYQAPSDENIVKTVARKSNQKKGDAGKEKIFFDASSGPVRNMPFLFILLSETVCLRFAIARECNKERRE